jgi:hypothetical protein
MPIGTINSMKGINIPCQQAAKLVDKRNVKRLSFLELLQLKFHNNLCVLCAKYQKQSKRVDELIYQRILKSNEFNSNSKICTQLKLNIKKQLKEL